jgi:hypothetical protein
VGIQSSKKNPRRITEKHLGHVPLSYGEAIEANKAAYAAWLVQMLRTEINLNAEKNEMKVMVLSDLAAIFSRLAENFRWGRELQRGGSDPERDQDKGVNIVPSVVHSHSIGRQPS